MTSDLGLVLALLGVTIVMFAINRPRMDTVAVIMMTALPPVAPAVAAETGASPYPFTMTVALAASAAFMTPVSSPVNTLVVEPGNYRFFDFVRIGVPFAFVAVLATVLLVPWVFPL